MKFKLNTDLFSLHVVDSPECICGNDVDDSEHFFLMPTLLCAKARDEKNK